MQSIAFLPWAFSTCQGGFYLLLNVFTEAVGPAAALTSAVTQSALFCRQWPKTTGPGWELGGPGRCRPITPTWQTGDHKHVTWPGVTRW